MTVQFAVSTFSTEVNRFTPAPERWKLCSIPFSHVSFGIETDPLVFYDDRVLAGIEVRYRSAVCVAKEDREARPDVGP